MMSISATLFGEISHASLFFYWPAAEPRLKNTALTYN